MSVLLRLVAAALLVLSAAGCGLKSENGESRGDGEAPSNVADDKCGGGVAANDAHLIEDVSVAHTTTTIEVQARLAELDPDRDQYVWFAMAVDDRAWTVHLSRSHTPSGRVRPSRIFAEAVEKPDPHETHGCVFMTSQVGEYCRLRGRIDGATGVARLVLPRTCLENPGSVSLGVRVGYLGPKRRREVASDVWDEGTLASDRWVVPPLSEPIEAAPGAPIGCQEWAPETMDAPGPGPGQIAWMGDPPCIR